MTSNPCSAVPRPTLLTFALGKQELPAVLMAEVATHVRHCGRCQHQVRRLRSSRQALRTLGFTGGWPELEAQLRIDAPTRLRALRGKILGAARDRAWSELNRHLQVLRRTGRQLDPCRRPRDGSARPGHPDLNREGVRSPVSVPDGPDSAAVSSRTEDGSRNGFDKNWEEQRLAVGALAYRLQGLGIHVDLSDLPLRRPSAPALPWVIRHLDDLLMIVGGADAGHALDEDYQPSAAPSFLDSLPPL